MDFFFIKKTIISLRHHVKIYKEDLMVKSLFTSLLNYKVNYT